MRSTLSLIAVVALVTIVIGLSVWQMPYFFGDVEVARWLQSSVPDTSWAAMVGQIATAPAKYFVMGLTIGLAFALAGFWGGVIAIVAIALDQYGGEASKALFARPRPSPLLINVSGNPTGYSFPSTTLTFFSATFGVLAVLAFRSKGTLLRWPTLFVSVTMILLACVARVVLGAHWPSDVVLTVAIFVAWIWTASKALY